jgi:myo-inositol-1(or 4)-monophosphatase
MQKFEINEAERFMSKILVSAGKKTLKLFGKAGVKYTKKNISDVVTEADLISNKYIINEIRKKYPDFSIISEETKEYEKKSDYVWTVDPLDGTRNFSSKSPLYGVMMALLYKNEIILGGVYIPFTKELFTAKKGKGAFRNGKRIFCSQNKEFEHSYGICGSRFKAQERKIFTNIFNNSNNEDFWIFAAGCAAIMTAYMADGRKDWFILSGCSNIWDMAPTYIILKEAGCIITNLKGEKWSLGDNVMMAGNPHIQKKILMLVKS